MKRLSHFLIIGVTVSLFSGCAYQHRKPSPEFQAVRPPPIQATRVTDGAIYQPATARSLFETTKASRIGDILTVVFDEKHVAKKETKTEDKKSSGIKLSNPIVFGKASGVPGTTANALDILNMNIASNNDFKAKGKSEQKDSLTGSISVTVVEVLPNGNLVVRGEKLLTLNQGDEYVQLSGIVRGIDVGIDNTVASSKIANAKIVYSGQGMTHDSNKGGWGTRFFLSDMWPF